MNSKNISLDLSNSGVYQFDDQNTNDFIASIKNGEPYLVYLSSNTLGHFAIAYDYDESYAGLDGLILNVGLSSIPTAVTFNDFKSITQYNNITYYLNFELFDKTHICDADKYSNNNVIYCMCRFKDHYSHIHYKTNNYTDGETIVNLK